MKKFLTAVVALTILIATTAFAAPLQFGEAYVGNAKTKKFHVADCHMVDKMNPNNKVYLKTREEAINAGYVPCKRCNP